MVLGLRSRHRRGASVKVDYIVHVEEIRPWPPSESLRSVQTVLLQWENGNQYTGSFPSTFQGSKIVFKESFKLPLILYQDKKVHDKFQKNLLEFSLFVLRKDKAKGQLLGTAVVNLADYGVVESTLSINVPVNFKKSSNNSVQSALVISLEPVVKDISNSSPNVSLSKETSLDNDYDDLEIASITDDDASSQSSRTAGSSTFEVGASSPPQIDKNAYANAGFDPEHNSGRFSSTDASSSDTGNHGNDHVFFSKLYDRSMTSVEKKSGTSFLGTSVSSVGRQDVTMKPNTIVSSLLQKKVSLDSNEAVTNSKNKTIENIQQSVEGESFEEFVPEAIAISADNRGKDANESYSANSPYSSAIQEFVPEAIAISADNCGKDADESYSANSPYSGAIKKNELQEADEQIDDLHADLSNVEIEKKRELTYMRSDDQIMEEKKNECKNEWETRVEMLEGELREAAAIEVGLYSVVAEHASSANKVHTPARRLSRFYTNACKEGFQAKRASAARAVVSGLVLVSKSCGHDVPRLTFWLSNAIMLRAIVSQNAAEFPHSDRPERKVDGAGTSESDDREDVSTFIIALEKIESWLFSRIVESLWWQTFTPHMQPTVARGNEVTLGSGAKKAFGRRSSLGNCEQGNFSTELWNKAFKDACERLCPLRAGGHECGCLTVLVRLVMEQLVNRLDVAMFNAILRESAEEMPTDPLSDPISDSKVLPIPAGKSSFGAGVELKNSIGNWSRWLTDIFGLDEDSTEHDDSRGDGKKPKSFKAFRLLHTLSDLMMLPFGMLADASTRKEVCPMFGPIIIKRVLSNFVPDEFCPDPIPQNIIDSLETEEVSEALEDLLTSFPCTASPTTYTPPSAALLTCVGEVGSQVLQSSRLSSLRKSYNSDDELDELDSPSASILPDSFHSSALAKLGLIAKEKGGGNVRRYQLLREIWKDE